MKNYYIYIDKIKQSLNRLKKLLIKQDEKTEPIIKTKRHYIAVLSMVTLLIISAFGIYFYALSPKTGALENADIIPLSEMDNEEYIPSSIYSECIYSTKKDMLTRHSAKVFTNYKDYKAWFDKYNDLPRTSPTYTSQAEKYFDQDYCAAVISPKDLHDSSRLVLSTIKFQGDNDNILIMLESLPRKESYKYAKNLEENCKQIYTVVFISPELLKTTDDFTFVTVNSEKTD